MDVTIVARSKEEKEKEKQHRAMLVAAFDDLQFRRYEQWRGARLSDAVVRRVTRNLP
jgi:transcription initiation factor TFIID subunit 11